MQEAKCFYQTVAKVGQAVGVLNYGGVSSGDSSSTVVRDFLLEETSRGELC